MAHIVTLLSDSIARRRLDTAVLVDESAGVRHRLANYETRADLIREVRRSPSAVLVIDPYHQGEPQLPLVWWCVRNAVSSSLLLYGDFSGRPAADVGEYVRLGVRWIVSQGIDDDATTLRRILASATNDLPSQAFLRRVRALVPISVYPVVEYTYYECHQPTTVASVAKAFACSERHLHRRLTGAHLPPPGKLIHWFRIIHAARLFDDPGRSLNQVAAVLGFSDPANMRRSFRALAGMAPSQLRARGGFRTLQEAFLASTRPTATPSASAMSSVS